MKVGHREAFRISMFILIFYCSYEAIWHVFFLLDFFFHLFESKWLHESTSSLNEALVI